MLVADIIPNNEKSYDKLGRIVGEARLAGFIDWNAIVDCTRTLRGNGHWRESSAIILSAAESFATDNWSKECGQDFRPEVWVEKDALGAEIAPAAEAARV